MRVAFATIRVKPECLSDFVAGMAEHAAISMTEPGCLRFDVVQDDADPTLVHMWQAFADEEANTSHSTNAEADRWRAASGQWRVAGEELTFVIRKAVSPISALAP